MLSETLSQSVAFRSASQEDMQQVCRSFILSAFQISLFKPVLSVFR